MIAPRESYGSDHIHCTQRSLENILHHMDCVAKKLDHFISPRMPLSTYQRGASHIN